MNTNALYKSHHRVNFRYSVSMSDTIWKIAIATVTLCKLLKLVILQKTKCVAWSLYVHTFVAMWFHEFLLLSKIIGQSDQNNSVTVSKLISQPAMTGSLIRTPSWLPRCCAACHNFDLSCKPSDQIALLWIVHFSFSRNYPQLPQFTN